MRNLLISSGSGNSEVDSVRSEIGSVSPASLDGSLAESTRSLMSPTDRESGTYASVKDMDEISIWKHILPPEEFEKQRQLGRKSEMRTGLASPIALTDDVSSQKLVKIDAIGKGSEVTGILEDLREEGTANAFVSKKTTKTFKIPRLKDDKDLVIALKKIKKSRAKKMRAKFPKAKPKNYPRPPIGGTSRRIGHQRGSFGNGQHLRNRPGRILNEGAAARKDTTDNELLGIISKKIVGGVGAPKRTRQCRQGNRLR